MKQIAIFFLSLFWIICPCFGQWIQDLENAEPLSEDIDNLYILEEWEENLRKNPLCINRANMIELSESGLFSLIQIQAILHYREVYGQIFSFSELCNIPAFSKVFPESYQDFLQFSEPPKTKFKAKQMIREGKSKLYLRYKRSTPLSAAYSRKTSSKGEKARAYLGSPDDVYMKYTFHYSDRFRIGFAAQKDAGEEFFQGNQKYGFDHYAGYLSYENGKYLKNLTLGNYSIQFGQGLSLGGFSLFGKTPDSELLSVPGKTIKAYASAGEADYFRGLASTWQFGKLGVHAFYSFQTIDDGSQNGYHRSLTEISKKNTLREHAGGFHLDYYFSKKASKIYRIGLSANYLAGFCVASLDYSFLFHRIHFFGENAANKEGRFALLNGLQWSLHSNFSLGFSYRYYSNAFSNPFASSFAENSQLSHEEGINICFKLTGKKIWRLRGSCDYFRFRGAVFGIKYPSEGAVFRLHNQFKIKSSASIDWIAFYKFKGEGKKLSTRLSFTYENSSGLGLQSRAEYVFFDKKGEFQNAFLIYQEVSYHFIKQALKICLRATLFDIEAYESRIYAYEKDLLYQFSAPAFFDKGCKLYALFRYKYNRHFSAELKLSYLCYDNKKSIGSGHDEIKGNSKGEIKAQLIFTW